MSGDPWADPLRAVRIHAFDQVGAALRDLAPVLGGFRSALVAQGFTRWEALLLVREVTAILLTAGPGSDDYQTDDDEPAGA